MISRTSFSLDNLPTKTFPDRSAIAVSNKHPAAPFSFRFYASIQNLGPGEPTKASANFIVMAVNDYLNLGEDFRTYPLSHACLIIDAVGALGHGG